MSRKLVVDVFVEDSAHEKFLLPLLRRIAHDEQRAVTPRLRSGRGGHAVALEEMRRVQTVIAKMAAGNEMPDIFVVAIDGNCTTANQKRKEIKAKSHTEFAGRLVIACPDPHIERWYMADPDSFHDVVSFRPEVGKEKCQRGHYKHLLSSCVRKGGHQSLLGGIEWADALVAAMDLYRAGKNDAALGQLISDLRTALRGVV